MYLEEGTMHFFHQITIPRKNGTGGHTKVLSLIKERFSEIPNLQVKTQQFSMSRTYMEGVLNLVHPVLGLIALCSFVFLLFGLNLLALVFSLISLFGALFNRQIIYFLQFRVQKIGKQIPAENIIGILKPEDDIKKNLVFVAHPDTISHRINPTLESVGYLAGFLGVFAYSIHLLIFSLRLINSPTQNASFIPLVWGIPIVILAFIGIFNQKSNESKGVLDNASGIVQMYDLARKLSKQPLQNTAVYFLCSDAEEMGDYGSHIFMKENPLGLRKDNTHFVVVDSIGAKSNNIVVNSISLPKRYFDPELEALMVASIEETNAPLKFQWIPPLLQVATDHVPIDLYGYQFLLVACSSFVFHGYSDNWDAFDQNNFDKICECIETLTYKFDK